MEEACCSVKTASNLKAMNQLKERIKVLLVDAWPAIYRMINTTFFFVIKLIQRVIRDGIKQIKGQL